MATRISAHAAQIVTLKREVEDDNKVYGLWQQLAVYVHFAELDWKSLVASIDRLERGQEELAAASDLLRTLQEQLRALGAEKVVLDADHAAAAALVEKLRTAREQLAQCDVLAALREQALGEHTLTVESCDNRERDMRDFIQARLDAETRKIERLRDTIISAMQDYVRTWPLDAREVDVSIDAAAESQRMLHVLEADDLPRFADKFKGLLNENTSSCRCGASSNVFAAAKAAPRWIGAGPAR